MRIMPTKKHRLCADDERLFAAMQEGAVSDREREFFANVRFKQEYEPTLANDVLMSENDNEDSIYIVRCEYEEYLVGRGTGDGVEEHVMTLSEALALNLKAAGCLNENITLQQWLRARDYAGVRYDHDYDLTHNGEWS